MTTKKWHFRGFTSLFTTAGFLVMSVTGIAAYIVPQGRIAYWTDWHFLGLSKTPRAVYSVIRALERPPVEAAETAYTTAGVTMAADANGLSAPMELLKAVLVDGYRPGGGGE